MGHKWMGETPDSSQGFGTETYRPNGRSSKFGSKNPPSFSTCRSNQQLRSSSSSCALKWEAGSISSRRQLDSSAPKSDSD